MNNKLNNARTIFKSSLDIFSDKSTKITTDILKKINDIKKIANTKINNMSSKDKKQ